VRIYIWVAKAVFLLALAGAIFGSAGFFAYELFVKPNRVPPNEEVSAYKPPPDPSLPELKKVLALKEAGKWVEAQRGIEAFLQNYPFSTKLGEARKALGEVNSHIFFSTDIPSPEKITYEVQRGDALAKIERKFNISRELLMRMNKLQDPRRLSIGQRLLITKPSFSIAIDRGAQTITLRNNHRFFREYHAASWTAPGPVKGAQPVEAKVRDKVSWHDGTRVHFGSSEYENADRWIELSVRGYTFYTEGGKKPAKGIGFSTEEMEELSTLLGKNVPVSIQ